jgi:hypothetical protein
MTPKYIVALLFGVCVLAACQPSEENEATHVDTAPSDEVIKTPQAIRSFTVGYGDYKFIVKGSVQGDSSHIKIDHSGTDYNGPDLSIKLPGVLMGALSADVNENFKPELYFWTRRGTRDEGFLNAFEFAKDLITIKLPDLSTKYQQGYAGRDSFYIRQDHLIRSFPVFNDQDGQLLPTDKERNLWYTLNDKGVLILIN